VDKPLRHRINAGRVAIKDQVDFFHHHFGEVPSAWKEDDTRVTFADFAISERLSSALRRSFPQDDFCSEEDGPRDEERELSARYTWVIDPIDGTNNYALGLPFCAISLGLLRGGEPVYGFLYDLGRKTLFQGGPGEGAFEGCRRLNIATTPPGPHGVLGIGFPLPPPLAAALLPALSQYRVRSLGSTALQVAYVAAGLLDGCLDARAKVWDLAAAVAILRGAGGTFQTFGPSPFPLRRFSARAPAHPFYAAGPGALPIFTGLLARLDPPAPLAPSGTDGLPT